MDADGQGSEPARRRNAEGLEPDHPRPWPEAPPSPAIASVGPGNTYLTIGWMAPEDIGASAITSYDLRYIRSDAVDNADEYWTPKMRIWSAGDLVYELSGLTLDVGYDVQVRAVNSAGAGPWSEVAQGQTMTAPPGAPAIDSVVAGDGEFTVSWSAPARNGGAEITRYDVRYIEEDETDRADSNWDVETAWNTGDGALEHTVSSIGNDLGYDIEVRAANSEGAGAWSATAILRRNQSPRFPSTETGLRSVDENTPSGRAVGAPVAATDEEGDTLTYSLAESGAAFSIDAGTGQLRTKDALNHEAADSRTVTVQVSDGKNARGDISTAVDATIVVTVTVNDVNEQPRADTDQVRTLEDERVMIDVLSNDFDPDDGDTVTVRIVDHPPRHDGESRVIARVVYTPGKDYVRRTTASPTRSGTPEGLTARARPSIVDIMPVNDAPTFPSSTAARSVPRDRRGRRPGRPARHRHGRRPGRHAHVQPLRLPTRLRSRSPASARSRWPRESPSISPRRRSTSSRSKPTTGSTQRPSRSRSRWVAVRTSRPRAAAVAAVVAVVAAEAAAAAPARA